MTVLAISDVHRSYERGPGVLRGIDLAVSPGEVVGLAGRNGAGKTTLIRIVMGMLEVDRGEVLVFGLSPRREPVEVKRRIGYSAERPILPARHSIESLLAAYRELYPRWDRSFERELLERFEIDPTKTVAELSKGQVQRVSLLLAMASRPDLLLLDEPASGLDPAARRDFLAASVEMVSRHETAVLFSSHYLTDVARVASRVAILHEGRIVVDTDLDTIGERYCIAAIASGAADSSAALSRLAGCLEIQENGSTVRAVFARSADDLQQELDRVFPGREARSVAAPLEELFLTLVGREAA